MYHAVHILPRTPILDAAGNPKRRFRGIGFNVAPIFPLSYVGKRIELYPNQYVAKVDGDFDDENGGNGRNKIAKRTKRHESAKDTEKDEDDEEDERREERRGLRRLDVG